jgi:hypothetical protein
MRDLMVLGMHLLVTLARLLGPGGVRAVTAESLLLKHQLVIVARCRRRAPKIAAGDSIQRTDLPERADLASRAIKFQLIVITDQTLELTPDY